MIELGQVKVKGDGILCEVKSLGEFFSGGQKMCIFAGACQNIIELWV